MFFFSILFGNFLKFYFWEGSFNPQNTLCYDVGHNVPIVSSGVTARHNATVNAGKLHLQLVHLVTYIFVLQLKPHHLGILVLVVLQ